jgi:AAA15 family ATPase/GTPase
MVLEIRLSNLYSIKDEIVLDLRAGNGNSRRTQALQGNTFFYKDEQILKSVALYGSNASGKSNIIKAISGACSMIFNSHHHNENNDFTFSPFKFDNYPKRPSRFFIRFVMNEVEYEYLFSLTRAEIITEELFYYPNGRRAKIFTRDETQGKEKNKIYKFGSVIRKPMDVAENTSRKSLFISRASQMDRSIAKDIFNFFHSKFVFSFENQDIKLVENLYKENRDTLLKALKIADSDIINVSMSKDFQPAKFFNIDANEIFTTAENEFTMPLQDSVLQKLTFKTIHKANDKIVFNLHTEESAGTQKMFYMMLCIIDVIKNNKILLVDEIENSLHNKIVEYIIELFHSSHSAQLIYTTHNTKLLNLNKLRTDQICFVNKREDGSSDLYSLFDYKDFRDTMDVEKAYLQGRFDAIPYIDDTLENLKTILQ